VFRDAIFFKNPVQTAEPVSDDTLDSVVIVSVTDRENHSGC